MSSIDELRRTLGAHANSVHDTGVVGRADAARAQARRDRARRRALTAAVAVAVLAVGVTISVWPGSRQPEPADRMLNGHEAPATLKSLGYTYRFVTGAEGHDGGSARLGLGASSRPRLVSWAADSGARVRVTSIDGEVVGDAPTEFGDFVLVPPGSDAGFRARGNEPALAVYELTDAAPPGYTIDGTTFRERVGSDRLVAARIGEPGQRDVSFDFEVPDGYLVGSTFCTAGGSDARVHVTFGRDGDVSTGGCDDPTFDPGGLGGFGYDSGIGVPPGQTATARVWVTGRHGDVPDDVRIGLGLYVADPPGAEFPGWHGIPELQEYAGHTWKLDHVTQSPRGARELTEEAPAGSLVYFYSTRLGTGTVHTLVDDAQGGGIYATGGGAGVIAEPSLSAHTYGLRVSPDMNPRGRLGLAVYERID